MELKQIFNIEKKPGLYIAMQSIKGGCPIARKKRLIAPKKCLIARKKRLIAPKKRLIA